MEEISPDYARHLMDVSFGGLAAMGGVSVQKLPRTLTRSWFATTAFDGRCPLHGSLTPDAFAAAGTESVVMLWVSTSSVDCGP